MSYTNTRKSPSFMEKLIAVASYIFPMIGFVVVIISVLMKANMKPFLRYHIFQSIFISFALLVVYYGLTLVMNMLSVIPVVNNVIMFVTFFLNTKLFLGFSVITFVYFVFLLYLIIGVLRGTNSYVPWVSDIIKANLRG